jgi:hypothetical protein
VREGEGDAPQHEIGVGVKPAKKLTERGKTWGGTARRCSGGREVVQQVRRAAPQWLTTPGTARGEKWPVRGAVAGELRWGK